MHALVPNIHNLVHYFNAHPLKDIKMRMDFFYAITIIREFTNEEKIFLKKTVKELAFSDNSIL